VHRLPLDPLSEPTRQYIKQPGDFSLVLGGPLYQLFRRTSLAGDALQLLHRRIIALVLLAWGPLLVLSVAEGTAWGDSACCWRCRCWSWPSWSFTSECG